VNVLTLKNIWNDLRYVSALRFRRVMNSVLIKGDRREKKTKSMVLIFKPAAGIFILLYLYKNLPCNPP
jgi:hypothetical protein